MNCPTCPDAVLVMTDRSGIEIDYCPSCRGVWLDRGELDKIIERSLTAAVPPARAPEYATASAGDRHRDTDRRDRDDDGWDDDRSEQSRKRKRSSLLGELFDF
jgi:Zn-finger nucleic acid-binding protein